MLLPQHFRNPKKLVVEDTIFVGGLRKSTTEVPLFVLRYSSTMDPSWVTIYRQGTSTELIRFCHVDAKPFCILSIQGSLSHACRKVE
jgi:hypothetical protein